MSLHRILIQPGAVEAEAEDGTNLAEALFAAGRPISLYCRKRGVCGKCLVEIAAGDAGCPDPAESEVLARRGAPARTRLACRVAVSGPLTVVIPEASLIPSAFAAPGRVEGFRRSIAVDPPLRKYAVRPEPPSLQSPVSDLERLYAALPEERWEPSAAAIRRLAAAARPGISESVVTAVVHGRALLDVEPGDTSGLQLGLAVDLGTTTVAAELIDLESGRTLAAEISINAQGRFGADIVSRITAARAEPAAAAGLQAAAWETINAVLSRLLDRTSLPSSAVYETVLAGNTAMIHLALGLSVATLTEAPFQSLVSALPALSAGETGSAANPVGRVYFAPAIKSFVGGDISAGLTAMDIESGPGRILFIDLGTNGEIVLKNGGRLTCTSTAAGPAFEGMSLSCGMIAGPGAVQAAAARDGGLALSVVGGGSPIGLCGSGLIDVLAVALERGWMDESGVILAPGKTIKVAPSLALGQKDVREVQLAAAAVKTGMRMLLQEAGLATDDLDGVWIAGAFGSTLDIENAVRLGLIPAVGRDKIRFVGNTSLAGARVLLLSDPERARCEDLARRIRHISLASGGEFQDRFVESLTFTPWR
ncbi:MAG: ASKHA domain-containing protein [Acidobacteriota bacterium]|nr:ASKHA domain-containing protein [Acidobacteriota bacterium]